VIQAPGGPEEDQTDFTHGGWVFPYFDESLDEPMCRLLGGSHEGLVGIISAASGDSDDLSEIVGIA